MKSLLQKKISLVNYIISLTISIALTFYISTHHFNESINLYDTSALNNLSSVSPCNIDIKRLNGFEFIKPLMFVDNECESQELFFLKDQVNKIIQTFKVSGDLTSASVYLKCYPKNEWMGINENEKFSPGSLLKVPVLITFLKMNEKTPGFLDKTLFFSHPFPSNKTAVFLSNQIQLGHNYTIKELLKYMIAYSDNNATNLLNTVIDVNMLQKIFTDFGLEAPNWISSNYPISSKNYSLFMRALYNGSYLSNEDSEFATELLTHSDFKKGLIKDIPDYIKKAHKFGEGGIDTEPELSESALVYLENKPYLLTIMTKGKDNQKLAQIISQISNIIYQSM